MSYDLYFKPRNGLLTEEDFFTYFSDRPNYKCEGSQALYSNEDTGVYFLFEFQSTVDSETERELPVTLNINYFRPSYFIFEAELEVTAFVKYFDLLVSDPQTEGMGDGEYKVENLHSGWNYGNEFGYKAILKDEGNRNGISHLPSEQLQEAWRWNLSRSKVQAHVGETKFVPRIMFLNLDGTAITAAVWPDGIPAVVTPVDYLCVPRKELAPTKFFRGKEDTTLVPWEKARPILIAHGTQNTDGSISLNYQTPPTDVVKFVKSLPVERRSISGLSADRVLDRELYERSIA